jgi:DNA-binding NarL/FixJ family response regulator
MIQVCIVDDHQLILEGLQSLLQGEAEISVGGLLKNAEDLLSHISKNLPDVILMDINLPRMNGLELCKLVTHEHPSVKVIGLSTSNQISVIKNMLASGASGYLLKDASKNEIVDAVKTVYRGKEYVNHSIAEVLKITGKAAEGLPVLTRREREILELISDGMTNAEIAKKLFVTVTTVDSHRKNMLMKFEVKNTAALVKLAITNHLI